MDSRWASVSQDAHACSDVMTRYPVPLDSWIEQWTEVDYRWLAHKHISGLEGGPQVQSDASGKCPAPWAKMLTQA